MKKEKTYDKDHSINLKFSELTNVRLNSYNGCEYTKFNL
jgi:hypothetical protein